MTRLATPAEFDAVLSRAEPWLAEVRRRGGDPRFVLWVLASARWRRLRPPGAKFSRWGKALRLLAADEELHRLIGSGHEPRMQLKAAAADAVRFLETFAWMDDGPFDSITTWRSVESPRWASRRTDQAAAVVAWHLKKGLTVRRGYLVLLAQLLEAFNLIISRGGESPPFDAVKQRLKRMKGDYYQKFSIPRYRLTFHENHDFLARQLGNDRLKQCGTACFPQPPSAQSELGM